MSDRFINKYCFLIGRIMRNQFKVIIVSSILLIVSLKGCDRMQQQERSSESRLSKYSVVSNRLACLSDKQLEDLLKTATGLSVGYGENVGMVVDGVSVFVKKIPLTDLERKPENIRSTANLFNSSYNSSAYRWKRR